MIVCAGFTEQFSFAKSFGIGSDFGINLAIFLSHNPDIKRLQFIGSFGLYTNSHELFSLHSFTTACNKEHAQILCKCHEVGLSKIENKNNFHYKNYDFEIFCHDECVLNSSNLILCDSEVATNLHKNYNLLGENMECYHFFKVANLFNISANALLVATNYCGQNSHEEYLQNYRISNEILNKIFMKASKK